MRVLACEACSSIKRNQRATEILERRLAAAITLDEAITMDVGDDDPVTWWRIENRQGNSLMEMLEQICDDAWDMDIPGLPVDFELPAVVEFVVGKKLTFDVRESLSEMYQDYNDGPPEFDSDAVKFAQEAVDLAAATASYWGQGQSYWVDIREIRDSVLREWLPWSLADAKVGDIFHSKMADRQNTVRYVDPATGTVFATFTCQGEVRMDSWYKTTTGITYVGREEACES